MGLDGIGCPRRPRPCESIRESQENVESGQVLRDPAGSAPLQSHGRRRSAKPALVVGSEIRGYVVIAQGGANGGRPLLLQNSRITQRFPLPPINSHGIPDARSWGGTTNWGTQDPERQSRLIQATALPLTATRSGAQTCRQSPKVGLRSRATRQRDRAADRAVAAARSAVVRSGVVHSGRVAAPQGPREEQDVRHVQRRVQPEG